MPRFNSVREVFEAMPGSFRPEKANGAEALVGFELHGDGAGRYWVHVQDGACRTGLGDPPRAADATVTASAEDWLRVSNGQLNPVVASVLGKLKIEGELDVVLRVAGAFPRD